MGQGNKPKKKKGTALTQSRISVYQKYQDTPPSPQNDGDAWEIENQTRNELALREYLLHSTEGDVAVTQIQTQPPPFEVQSLPPEAEQKRSNPPRERGEETEADSAGRPAPRSNRGVNPIGTLREKRDKGYVRATLDFFRARKSPYYNFLQNLSVRELSHLLRESALPIQKILLRNAGRSELSQVLNEMPAKERNAWIRTLSRSRENLNTEEIPKIFHWLRRKLSAPQSPLTGRDVPDQTGHRHILGWKVLNQILDGLYPKQETQILEDLTHEDSELSEQLIRERGSAEDRKILSGILRHCGGKEVALLYTMPKLAPLLSHLLSEKDWVGVCKESIDLAKREQTERERSLETLLEIYPELWRWR